MTESAAKEQDQSNEEEEEDALMSFVENLNFQQFTDDMELKILIEQVKSRINDIQREKKKDEIKLQATMDVSFSYINELEKRVTNLLISF